MPPIKLSRVTYIPGHPDDVDPTATVVIQLPDGDEDMVSVVIDTDLMDSLLEAIAKRPHLTAEKAINRAIELYINRLDSVG